MTINGPAPMLLGFYMNAAIDQGCERYIRAKAWRQRSSAKIDARTASGACPGRVRGSRLPRRQRRLGLLPARACRATRCCREVYERIKAKCALQVRGTVQADILKEDQAQNTCIFSTEFALRMMGDIQQYFIANNVRNFYSVSISGYHIAEAGANPITQLAFTLANGFTYVEYYLVPGDARSTTSRRTSAFFFSNGVDPEYSVIGRVARRIWAKAMKSKYGGTSAARS
jgi:methylmalonyl-CoA mutase